MGSSSTFQRAIESGYRLLSRRRLTEAALLGLSLGLPLLVAGVAIGMVLRFHVVTGWLVPAAALGALTLGVVGARRFLRRYGVSFPEFVRLVERKSGLNENELVNAAELERSLPAIQDQLSRGLAEHAVGRGFSALSTISVKKLAPAISLRGPALRAGAALVLMALLSAVAPDAFVSSTSRLVRPGSRELPPAQVIQVQPGDATLERGSSVVIRAEVPAHMRDAKLMHRARGGAWKTLDMAEVPAAAAEGAAAATADHRPAFRVTLADLVEDTEYAVESGEAKSEVFHLSVTDPLRAAGYLKRVEPPAYTGLSADSELSGDGNVSAVVGSRFSLGVQSNRKTAEGRLVFEDGTTVGLTRGSEEQLAAAWPIRHSGSYRVELWDDGLPGVRFQSDSFQIEAVPDRPPTLYQLAPERTSMLPSDMVVRLDAECLDDFGLTKLDLVWRRNDRADERVNLGRWQGERQARLTWDWDLSEVLLTPGDVAHFHLEVTDNDGFSGGKTTLGPECEVRFPTLEEMYLDVSKGQEEQVQNAEKLAEDQKALRQELEKARNELRKDRTLGWEKQEQMKDLAARQQELADKIDKLAESMDQSLDRMEQSEAFSPELMQKVKEISDLVKQIQSPSFKKQMDDLKRAMERLDRQAIDQALEKLQMTQKDLEQSLDRTLETLKRMLAEEKVEDLIRQAERMAEQQRELNEQMSGHPEENPADSLGQAGEQRPPDSADSKEAKDPSKPENKSDSGAKDSAERQRQEEKPMSKEDMARLQEKQRQLAEELKKLQQKMDEMKKEAAEHLKDMAKEMEQRKPEESLNDAQKKMGSAEQQMGQCNKPQGLRFGREAQKKLQEFQKQMQAAQQASQKKESDELVKRLYALSGQLVSLSQSQETLLDDAPSRATRELAEDQSRLLDGAKRTLDELYALSRLSRMMSPELGRVMGEAVRQLESSTNGFEEGDRSEAVSEGRDASGSLDATVIELLATSAKMQNQAQCSGGSCSNPSAGLRGLSGQQQQLNDEGQSMLQGNGGQRLSSSGSAGEKLAQMAARQQMIQKGLADLQQSTGDGSDVLGRLGDIAGEMEEIASEIREHGLDERLLERQQKILSRLLTAQKSIRKEGEKDQRESRAGVNPADRPSPGDVPLALSRSDLLRRGILRGGQDPVPSDYRKLVDEYFRSLAEHP